MANQTVELYSSVEIKVVNNGYVVITSSPQGPCALFSYMNAFESFESLVTWLKTQLKEPEDG